jgi:hypothetical protein
MDDVYNLLCNIFHYYSCSYDIVISPIPILETLESLSKHHLINESFCHNKYPNVDFSKFPHKQHNKNVKRWKKKEFHPLQDYCKNFEIAERKQRSKRSRNPKTQENFTPTHSLKKRILSTFAMVIKTYYVQLPKNLMYLRLHPPKHGKLHPCENFHYVNTCHLHIGERVRQNFIPKSKSYIDA